MSSTYNREFYKLQIKNLDDLLSWLEDPSYPYSNNGIGVPVIGDDAIGDRSALDSIDALHLYKTLNTALNLQPNPYHSSPVIVMRDDPASLLGIVLACYMSLPLLIEIDSTFQFNSSFTLLGSSKYFTYEMLSSLASASAARSIPYSIVAGEDTKGLSNYIYNLISNSNIMESKSGSSCVFLMGGTQIKHIDSTNLSIVVDPTKEDTKKYLSSTMSTFSTLNHGREYCGFVGNTTLCCSQSDQRCVDDMDCSFGPELVQLNPSGIKSKMCFINSCSVLKFSSPSLATKNVGLELIKGTNNSLIAPYELSYGSVMDNLLFHKLSEHGFTLGEITLLLNNAHRKTGKLIGIGLCDSTIQKRKTIPTAETNPVDEGDWYVRIPVDGSIYHLENSKIRSIASEGAFYLLDIDNSSPVEAILLPGIHSNHSILFFSKEMIQGQKFVIGHRKVGRLVNLRKRITAAKENLDLLQLYFNFDKDGLKDIEAHFCDAQQAYLSLDKPHSKTVIRGGDFDQVENYVNELTYQVNAILLERFNKAQFIKRLKLEDFAIDEVLRNENCSNCSETISTSMLLPSLLDQKRLALGLCPCCGIVFCRSTPDLRMSLDNKLSLIISNLGDITKTLHLRADCVPELVSYEPVTFAPLGVLEVAPNETITTRLQPTIPAEYPTSINFIQITAFHEFKVDFSVAPFLIAENRFWGFNKSKKLSRSRNFL